MEKCLFASLSTPIIQEENSGSPVFNSKGELIGTGFDRNYEGLTGDIAFRPSSQRAACVDIRYTLFIIEEYAGASHLINKLTIKE
ncbi:MAG: S46 family peptidase [Bacteroides graminisolvens]